AQAGRVAVVVAGGGAITMALEEPALARVCGQSGVAPKCADYDCHDTWGWCWYARGCCADGALKKICDCCAPNTPHPVGYCPSGTRVKCIVESCGADPRLQTKIIRRLRSHDPVELSLAVSRTRFGQAGRPVAVLGDAGSSGFAALAAGLTRVADAPVLLSAPDTLDGRVGEELARLQTEFVLLVGRFSPVVEVALVAQGRHVTRLNTQADPVPASAEVGTWVRRTSGARTAVVVLPGVGYQAVAQAGALAAAKGWPLLVGDGAASREVLREPEPVHRTLVVSGDPADAARFPGGEAIAAGDAAGLAIALADRMVAEGVSRDTVALTPVGNAAAAAGLAGLAGPMLTYRAGSLDGAWQWLHAHRAGVQRAFVAGTVEEFGDRPYYDLQSLLNEFEAHLLRGQAGEGLPVISQPRSERPIGKARR
ncbi:MAG TPA: hypothetical protein VNU01_00555, partial [Egibacteraceae bacterium]|nr:hypothetical protein [Egibacteraceae bacterium]